MNKQTKIARQQLINARITILKGQENQCLQANLNANFMAEIETAKIKEEQIMKKEKISSFMNSTKLNASKFIKEKVEKNQQKLNSKKEKLEKQRQLKQKYTNISKKALEAKKTPLYHEDFNQQLIKVSKDPHKLHNKVSWKKADSLTSNKVHIPHQNQNLISDEDSEVSRYDSEVQIDNNENPEQIIKNRERIKSLMLQRMKM